MRDQRRFHLGRAHPVARDIDHVIHTARDPIIAIRVAAAAIAREIVSLVVSEIGFLEALMIAILEVVAPDHLTTP